jgi:hypothetical protein
MTGSCDGELSSLLGRLLHGTQDDLIEECADERTL